MTIARRALARGTVQGVGFRYYTQREACRIGVAGWVRNLRDGRVEVRIEGAQEAVDELLCWLRRGPPGAEVLELEVAESPVEGSASFEVVSTA